MKNRIKYPFINLVFFALLLTLSGCANDMEPDATGSGNLPPDGTPLTIRATASGFHAPAPDGGGSPATRTPVMEGTSTKFQAGDAIGLFCVRKKASGDEYISPDIYNLKMTYTAAAGGTTGTWEAPATESAPLVYTDAVTYFAYYPYTDELTNASVSNEQTIREWLKTNKSLPAEMLTLDVLAANDLMTATALPSQAAADRGALVLNFKHEYALLVIKPMLMSPCIPPAGVTAYSYHAGARQWGIDRNIQQGWEFKMLINNAKACEMNDGTYRILTQATNTGSFIECDYTTHDDYYGLYRVIAKGSAIPGGFQANTCYTLEVRCTERTGTAVERALQPGDFVYQHNSKIEIYPGDGEVDAEGKIPAYAKAVGIVVTTDPARLTDAECNAKGWNHAYVMGLANISPGQKTLWMKNGRSLSTPYPYPPVANMNTAETYMNGYAETETMLKKTPLSDYPIFAALQQYRKDNTVPTGIDRSPWFIPSIGQWFDVMITICGKSPHDFATKEIAEVGGWGAWQSSGDERVEMLDKANKYLAKIGTTFLMPSSPEEHDICFWLTSHFGIRGIWAFYGTDRTGPFSVEPTYGNLENFVAPIAVARPFFAF